MHVVPATWNIMAPAQPVEIFLIPRPSSKAAFLQENFPEPLCAHFPLGVSRAFEGGGTLSQSPPAHTQLGVPRLGALLAFPIDLEPCGIVFFSTCCRLVQAWG